jgi:heme/copper-type cytochrome/quinol oxidase subunit 3
VVLIGFLWSAWRGRPADDNPWKAGTLEWSIPSPPHPSGFPRPPVVRDRYPAVAAAVVVGAIGWWLCREPVLVQCEADDLADRLKLPLVTSGTRSAGWWGMLGMIAILFTIIGALIYSYYYLRLYSDQWPQMGIAPPQLAMPITAYAVLAAGGLAQVFNLRARRRRLRRTLIRGTVLVLLLGTVFFCGELWNLITQPFSLTGSAYGSIFFTLNGFILLTVLTGLFLLGGTLVRMLRLKEPVDAPRLRLWLQNSELFWFFAVAAGLLAFVTTYLTPHLL